jgi:predicted RNase H-related nuclease YkuK (DUF458 family)
MNGIVIVMLIVVLALGVLMLFILMTTRKKSGILNKEEYQVEWLKIENSLKKGETGTFELAMINADKLLDKAMRELGIAGITMAERIKTAAPRFSNVKRIWAAHNLRNKIAHESDYNLKIVHARAALAAFKRGLRELGAI